MNENRIIPLHPQHKISFELIKSSFSARFHVWTITAGAILNLACQLEEREVNFYGDVRGINSNCFVFEFMRGKLCIKILKLSSSWKFNKIL
jgi:hypothetical protein